VYDITKYVTCSLVLFHLTVNSIKSRANED